MFGADQLVATGTRAGRVNPADLQFQVPAWTSAAACKDVSPTEADRLFFSSGRIPLDARAMCAGCPVNDQCYVAGLSEGYGAWGGEQADRGASVA